MKLLLLDDHKLFGESLKSLLEDQKNIDICEYASNIAEFFELFEARSYDIALVDINLKEDKTGLDLISEILSKRANQAIVILTSYDLVNYKDMALSLGVKDFINKSIDISDLVERLEKVYIGRVSNKATHVEDPLTNREIEVLRELIKGENKKAIAKKLFISERTLYNHIGNIYDKLNANNVLEAYNKAMGIGYIDPVM